MKHIIIILTILMSIIAVSCTQMPDGKKAVIQCTQEQKSATACTKEYMPVCGWFNETIKCFRYPCASVFSNKCMACISPNVDEYTEGACPR